MDLDQLVEQVAERVVAELFKTNRIIVSKPKQALPAPFNQVLDSLAAGLSVAVSKNNGHQIVIRAITKHSLIKLLAINGAPNISGATLTAALKARGIRPFVPNNSADPRCRYYLHGIQTQCYVLDNSITNDELLFKALAELSAECPELGYGNAEF